MAKIIDHTLLAPDAKKDDVRRLCAEARELSMGAVCVNPVWVKFAAEELAGTDIAVCTVVGFPLGASTTPAKVAEARHAVADGAREIDMVMNIGAAKDGDFAAVEKDISAVVAAVKGDALVKVILETCLLSDDEIVAACKAARAAGADFVKTSTGFSTHGATTHAVALMSATVGDELGVKASGGIRTRADLDAMVAAGATRIGASAGAALLEVER